QVAVYGRYIDSVQSWQDHDAGAGIARPRISIDSLRCPKRAVRRRCVQCYVESARLDGIRELPEYPSVDVGSSENHQRKGWSPGSRFDHKALNGANQNAVTHAVGDEVNVLGLTVSHQ